MSDPSQGKGKGKAKDDDAPAMQALDINGSNVPAPDNIYNNILLIEELCRKFRFRCRNSTCQAPLPLGSFRERIAKWTMDSKAEPPAQLSMVSCGKCAYVSCVGCGKNPRICPTSCVMPLATINNCCDGGRLFGIWLLLTRFDSAELQFHKEAAENMKRPIATDPLNDLYARTSIPTRGSSSPSFFTNNFNQASYLLPNSPYIGSITAGNANANYYSSPFSNQPSGPSPFSRPTPIPTPESNLKKQNDDMDMFLSQTLLLLTAFLPSSDPNLPFDANPPAELFSLFRLSFLFDRVNAVVRNDAIADMAQRSQLYQAVFEFLTAIAKHPGLVRIVTEKRPSKKQYPGLQKLCEEAPSEENTTSYFDASPSGMVASVVTCCQDTHKQAKTYAELASKGRLGPEVDDDDRAVSLSICRRVVKFFNTIGGTSPDAVGVNLNSEKDVWTEFHEENRVFFTDEVLTDHMFYSEFSKLNSSMPGRMSALGKEIANLSTSLPPGIFLKIGESRQDVMKALIIGVEGTPYAGGLFIFDIFLPADWPRVPPKVYSVLDEGYDRRNGSPTTGRGGLNPNIHSDGKICLSLLNTWSGSASEMWQPNKSTLLSVFVSIQSMIFGTSTPFLNEPGADGRIGKESPQCIEFSKNVQCKTVLYAMLYWLTSDKARSGVWGDISDIYWMCKKAEVMKTVQEWSKDNKGLRGYDKNRRLDGELYIAFGGRPSVQAGRLTVDLLRELSKHLRAEVDEKLEEVIEEKKGIQARRSHGSARPSQLPAATSFPPSSGPRGNAAPGFGHFSDSVLHIPQHENSGPSLYGHPPPKQPEIELLKNEGVSGIMYDDEGWQILPEEYDKVLFWEDFGEDFGGAGSSGSFHFQ